MCWSPRVFVFFVELSTGVLVCTVYVFFPTCSNISHTDILLHIRRCHHSGFSQFSSVPGPKGSSGGHQDRFSRNPLRTFLAGGLCEQFWNGQECPVFEVIPQTFPLLTTGSPTLQAPWRIVLGRQSRRVKCPNLTRFRLFTVGRSWSCSVPSRWSCWPLVFFFAGYVYRNEHLFACHAIVIVDDSGLRRYVPWKTPDVSRLLLSPPVRWLDTNSSTQRVTSSTQMVELWDRFKLSCMTSPTFSTTNLQIQGV